jgi:hypothetical protein
VRKYLKATLIRIKKQHALGQDVLKELHCYWKHLVSQLFFYWSSPLFYSTKNNDTQESVDVAQEIPLIYIKDPTIFANLFANSTQFRKSVGSKCWGTRFTIPGCFS